MKYYKLFIPFYGLIYGRRFSDDALLDNALWLLSSFMVQAIYFSIVLIFILNILNTL